MKDPWRSMAMAASALAFTGCAGDQSALSPAGDETSRFVILTLLLIGVTAVILGGVVALAGIALHGSDAARAALAKPATIWIGGIAFPIVVLSLLLAGGLWLMRGTVEAARREPDLRIEVTGLQWWWRVDYVLADGRRLREANEIRMPADRDVEFRLTSADVIHSFWIPSLGGKMDIIPGRTNLLRLTARQPGILRGQCAEYCGGPHALMAKDVVVMEPAAFDEWLAAAPAEPSGETERRGRALFLAAGCGACHAVRGTPAAGLIGPDLSRIGARRSIAAATLPNTPANLAAFIADGPHIKPGNLMPPFAILSAGDRQAIAAYLSSLK